MANFDKVFKESIILDGGSYFEGNAKYGLTEADARIYGFTGEFSLITIDDVKKIYFEQFWNPYNFGKIQNSKVARDLFEFTVKNNGELSCRILQRSFNLLNKNMLLKEDGIIGDLTIEYINSYKFYKSLYKMINILQTMYYIAKAEGDDVSVRLFENHSLTQGVHDQKEFLREWVDKKVLR